ncbi:helix-turn-helix domain-containing protein [Chryseobacterium sp. KACC 21268]|nr:helix-turn-helix domain-containing protein [Chryseobacterium sp. KACC 21268]
MKPNYKNIYTDILLKKFPHKQQDCLSILNKKDLSDLDVIELNIKIFGKKNKEAERQNQKYRSYNETTILEILDYKKKNNLNDSQLANHFKLSRNTVAKWKKVFVV